MDYTEKIKKIEENILKSEGIIAKEQTKIRNWKNEIKNYQDLEIKGLINEINIPYSELKDLLKGYKNNVK